MNSKAIKITRNILAVILGLVIGGSVNMLIVKYGSSLFPLPQGVNPQDIESIRANLNAYSFIIPWLAHAVGSFTGAIVTALIAASHKIKLALLVGVLFLIGGITMVFILPQTPLWFILSDLVLAYIPMAYFGGKIVEKS